MCISNIECERYEAEMTVWKKNQTEREIEDWKRSQQAKGLPTKIPQSLGELQSMKTLWQ
jgi:hypothetical protein